MFERRYNAVLLFALQDHIVAEKKIKMLELETLFMLVNAALHEYGPRFRLFEYGPKKWAKPHLKVFFKTKIENFLTLII